MCSKLRLERDNGESLARKWLSEGEGVKQDFQVELLRLVESDGGWEQHLGGLTGCKLIVEYKRCHEEFANQIISKCLALLLDEEPRVRFAVGEVTQLSPFQFFRLHL